MSNSMQLFSQFTLKRTHSPVFTTPSNPPLRREVRGWKEEDADTVNSESSCLAWETTVKGKLSPPDTPDAPDQGVTNINFRHNWIFKYIYIQNTIRTNIRIHLYQNNDTNEYPHIFVSKTLPEAQRTQGIDSLTWVREAPLRLAAPLFGMYIINLAPHCWYSAPIEICT